MLPEISPDVNGEVLIRLLSRYYKWTLQDHPTNIYVLKVTTPDGSDFNVDYRVEPNTRYFDVRSEAMRLYYWPSLLSSSKITPLPERDDWDDIPAVSTSICDNIRRGENISNLFIARTCQLACKQKTA